ncbi:MAG TPA: galactose-1-epimerase [Bacteroidales bacterium]|nr:galactose-1-epimerase [Bacteroidales bacterium]
MEKRIFGSMPNGEQAYLFSFENSNRVKVQVTNYGAKLVSVLAPDKKGNRDNIILGYKNLEHYLNGHQYLGATIGRVANRIANASFELNGSRINVAKNHGENHLHGGNIGFDSILWDIYEVSEDAENPSVSFQLISPDGDQGYPGNLKVVVKYTLEKDNSLRIDFEASTDKPTVVNLTNHAYFNLNPIYYENIYKHKAKFNANTYLETDANLIPTGRVLEVQNTPLDFREFKEIGADINLQVEPIMNTCGYDQFFVVNNYLPKNLNFMAEVEEPISGRVLQVLSTLPGMQFYTGNFLDTVLPTGYGGINGKHSSFCIEPSYFPDAPNHTNFKSIVITENDKYNETILFKFLTR